MTDSILWKEESDNYTKRAQHVLGNNLYSSMQKRIWSELCIRTFKKFHIRPKRILDVGCGFGASIYVLKEHFQRAKFYGLDPGRFSIKTARKHIKSARVDLKTGYLHRLPFKDGFFDVVILTMVLQWIPRRYLIYSLAEIDRVLSVNGIILLDEFLVKRPVRSQSIHNPKVYIFKQDYKKLFTSMLSYFELHQHVKNSSDEQRRQATIFLRKVSTDQIYRLRKGPITKSGTLK